MNKAQEAFYSLAHSPVAVVPAECGVPGPKFVTLAEIGAVPEPPTPQDSAVPIADVITASELHRLATMVDVKAFWRAMLSPVVRHV